MVEPAIHPHHRDWCHGGAATAWVATSGLTIVFVLSQQIRDDVERQRSERRMASSNAALEPEITATEFLGHLVAALLVAAVVGYVSHVIADATTRRGVPIIARKLI